VKLLVQSRRAAFTLVEIMMALAIFGLVLAAIYASWTLIIKSAQLGLEASARIQRERIALRTVEEALGCVRSFEADRQHYGFVAENGDGGMLSFVAQLPESFPRGGRFGDFDVRRVTFTLESGADSSSDLVLRQSPVLMDLDQDERDHPLVLARGVDKMSFEFWDDRKKDWVDEWTATNQLPKMIKLTLDFVRQDPRSPGAGFANREEVSRIIQLPSIMVPRAIQRPGAPGQQPGQLPGQAPGQPPVGGVPGSVPGQLPGQANPGNFQPRNGLQNPNFPR
jgi:general secretion pathway protein J